mmetsp:Transcript_3551/g.8230  ORF Transcript_3551/g.8230 Transcript_3551/m.8230 type:complete len:83 (+) Transcript_3551:56-304(+)
MRWPHQLSNKPCPFIPGGGEQHDNSNNNNKNNCKLKATTMKKQHKTIERPDNLYDKEAGLGNHVSPMDSGKPPTTETRNERM